MLCNNFFCNKEIIIFNSPLYRESWDDGEEHLPPLGLGYIITALNNAGIASGLVDCIYEKLCINDIVEIINKNDFSNVGFNVFSVNLLLIKEILLKIKRPVQIYLGGKAVEYLWKDIFSWNIDLPLTVIVGEGELILPDLIQGKCKQLPYYKSGKNQVMAVNKNSVYYPGNLDHVLLNRGLFRRRGIYNHYGRIEHCIIASRGCIYNCAFCGGSIYANPNITPRVRSNENIITEIKGILACNPEVESIRILDDLFLRNRTSIVNAVSIFNNFPQLHWRCMAHVKSFIGNFDLMDDLKNSGCDEVFIGIESGNPEVRALINKQGSVANVVEVVNALLTWGIDVKGYFICGFPGETMQQLKDSVSLASSLKRIAKDTKGSFRAVAFQFRPYHGTQLYDQLVKDQGNTVTYYLQRGSIARRRQYNFTAGNFSKVADEILENCIKQIMQ